MAENKKVDKKTPNKVSSTKHTKPSVSYVGKLARMRINSHESIEMKAAEACKIFEFSLSTLTEEGKNIARELVTSKKYQVLSHFSDSEKP